MGTASARQRRETSDEGESSSARSSAASVSSPPSAASSRARTYADLASPVFPIAAAATFNGRGSQIKEREGPWPPAECGAPSIPGSDPAAKRQLGAVDALATRPLALWSDARELTPKW
jgi:hypothetical protein